MLKEYLKKVINEEGYNNKTRLEQTDDLQEIVDGMNEMEFRQFMSKHLSNDIAWSDTLSVLLGWYSANKHLL